MNNKLSTYNRDNALIGNLGLGNQVTNFEGSEYLTITKTQIITSEYQLFFKCEFTPQAPNGNEAIYGPNISTTTLFINASSELKWQGNGLGSIVIDSINLDQKNTVKVEMKIGFLRITTNGNIVETPVTWSNTEWTSYMVCSSNWGSVVDFSGLIHYFKDTTETWNFANRSLTGSLGTSAVLTGSEGVLFEKYVAEDQTLGNNYSIINDWPYMRPIAKFTGSEYLTVNKTQTITDEYPDQPHFETEFTPLSPDINEALYSPIFADIYFFINGFGDVKILGNGIVNTTIFANSVNLGVKNKISLEFKTGFYRCILNGVEVENPATFTLSSWSSYNVSARYNNGDIYTGLMYYFKDHNETFKLEGNYTGSKGTIATLTGTDVFTESTTIEPNPTNDTAITTATGWTNATSLDYDAWVASNEAPSATFDGNGWADFPQQFDIPDLTPWELEVDLDMSATATTQNFIGDNELSNDRVYSSATEIRIVFSSGGISWVATIQGAGRTNFKIVSDGSNNFELFLDGVSQGSSFKTGSSAISIDNFGRGFTSGGSLGFTGTYYSTKLTINGIKVLDHRPTDSGFIDRVTAQTSSDSGTGTTYSSSNVFIDPQSGKRNLIYSTAQTGSDLTRALRFTNQ